ncbi:AEC family transporter [Clostridium vitabionis]|uniref:AEC family transporter n=1 Tax=Clostridium vitabionis TaxID=2784388 RepID=UPI00188CA310|nr:AEC family transporter [Clostridium vitabionis]
MLATLIIALNACVPYIIYLGIGYISRERRLASEDFFNKLNTFTFKLFFPCMMFYNFYNIRVEDGFDTRFAVYCVAAVYTVMGISCLIVPRLVSDRPKCGSIIQAVFRSNYLLFGVPMAEAVFGQEGSKLGAVILAFVIPIYNVMSVIILEYFHGGDVHPGKLIIDVLTTPLISGAICGSIFLLLHIPVPTCILNPVSKLSSLATPIAIITLGGTLHFNAIGKNLRYLVPVLLARLVFIPPIAVFVAHALGFSQVETFIVLILFATPVAAASYPMARNLGGDGELSGQLVVLSTVLSVGTIFCWIVLLRTIGII